MTSDLLTGITYLRTIEKALGEWTLQNLHKKKQKTKIGIYKKKKMGSIFTKIHKIMHIL